MQQLLYGAVKMFTPTHGDSHHVFLSRRHLFGLRNQVINWKANGGIFLKRCGQHQYDKLIVVNRRLPSNI